MALPALLMPASAGTTATATREAARATSLLTAEAMPARSAPTAPMAVVVRAGTVMTSPSPKTMAAGSTVPA